MHYYLVSYDITEAKGRNTSRVRTKLRRWLLFENHGIRLLKSQYAIKTNRSAKEIVKTMMNLVDSDRKKYVDQSIDRLIANALDIKDAAYLIKGRIRDENHVMRMVDRRASLFS